MNKEARLAIINDTLISFLCIDYISPLLENALQNHALTLCKEDVNFIMEDRMLLASRRVQLPEELYYLRRQCTDVLCSFRRQASAVELHS
jgi:hypothetical protein